MKRKHKFRFYMLLIVVISALVVSAMLLFAHFRRLRAHRAFRPPPALREFIRTPQSVPRLGIDDVSAIRPWMTFEFLNRAFGLPDDYLRRMLSVMSDRYPKIPIGKEAKESGVQIDVYISNLQDAVKNALVESSKENH